MSTLVPESTTNDGGQPQAAVPAVATATAAPIVDTKEGNQDGHNGDTDSQPALEGKEEWQVILALFTSNLSFANEGPGRINDFYDSGDDKENGRGAGGNEERKGSHGRLQREEEDVMERAPQDTDEAGDGEGGGTLKDR